MKTSSFLEEALSMPSSKPLAKIVEEYITGDGAMQD
jgi:hypothetical protein